MTLAAGLSIATGGLANIDRQLALLAHNVSNASTPGYVREAATQTALTANGVGLGVQPGPASRDLDVNLRDQLWLQSATSAGFQTEATALSAIDALNGTPGAGQDLASRLGALRDAFSTLATNPADQTGQRNAVDAAKSLVQTINALSTGYTAQRQAAQDAARADIDTLNQTLSQIGTISNQIIALKSRGESTADLENQRDAAVTKISQLVAVKSLAQPNGDLLLVTPQGLSLPTRGASATFSLAGTNMQPGAYYPAGGAPGIMLGGVDVTQQFGAGRIGSEVALRDTILPGYQAGLDEFAETLSQRFDAQGLRLFTDPTGAVPANGGAPVQTGYVGYAAVIGVNTIVDANAALLRDGTHTVAGSPTGASAFTPNPATGPAGFTTLIQRVLDFALGAEVQAGVANQAPNVAGLGPTGTLSLTFSAPATLADFATDLVAAQSADSARTTSDLQSATALQSTLQAKFDARTSVDMDTEMALMVQLQNAYAANARVLTTVQTMWDQLLGAVK